MTVHNRSSQDRLLYQEKASLPEEFTWSERGRRKPINMPGKLQLTAELKAAMRRQTILAHGFQKDQATAETRSSIAHAIHSLSQHAPDSWHLVLVSAYTAFNFRRGVQLVWRTIEESATIEPARKLLMGAQMREGILKCVPFLGIPRVLSCIGALEASQGKETGREIHRLLTHQASPPSPSTTSSSSSRVERGETRGEMAEEAGLLTRRGRALWDDVYSPFSLSQKLLQKIHGFHPDLDTLIVSSHYGHALSSTEFVNRQETSAIAVAVLRAEEDVLDQLTSHVFGLLKAGASQEYVAAIIAVVDGLRSGSIGSSLAKL